FFSEYGFGVKLNSFNGQFSMAHRHDDSIGGTGAHVQLSREALGINDQRMVANGGQRIFYATINGVPLKSKFTKFDVHDGRGANDLSAKRGTDALMAEANSENRCFFSEAGYYFAGNAGLPRSAGSGRNDDLFRFHCCDLFNGNLVVEKYSRLGAKLAQIVVEVIGKGIVVIDQEDHRFLHCSASSIALSMPRALFNVSWYSNTGSESATIPAPALMNTRFPFMTMVRITMQVSRFPLYPKYPIAPA